MLACLGELEMTQEGVKGFGALPFPAISPILCIDLEVPFECLHSLLWMKTQPEKICVVSESRDDGLLYLRVPH